MCLSPTSSTESYVTHFSCLTQRPRLCLVEPCAFPSCVIAKSLCSFLSRLFRLSLSLLVPPSLFCPGLEPSSVPLSCSVLLLGAAGVSGHPIVPLSSRLSNRTPPTPVRLLAAHTFRHSIRPASEFTLRTEKNCLPRLNNICNYILVVFHICIICEVVSLHVKMYVGVNMNVSGHPERLEHGNSFGIPLRLGTLGGIFP